MVKIGIPRGLYHQTHYPWWQRFFTALGAQVLISPPTNDEIMSLGVGHCLKEACLPVKVMHGHVLALKDQVDYLFLPHWTSFHPGEYLCPQLAGSSLMIRHTIPDLPPLISPEINLYSPRASLYHAAETAGKALKAGKKQIRQAFVAAGAWPKLELAEELAVRPGAASGRSSYQTVVGLLGHDYTLFDSYLNLNLVKKLSEYRVQVTAPVRREPGIGGKTEPDIFWSCGVDALHILRQWLAPPAAVQGIIYLMPFGCGVDAFVADLAERMVRQESALPFLLLTLDEHAGEAGINTRLEAFLDTVDGQVEWKEAAQ